MEIEAERFCIQCGYDLRGIASDKCPECGWIIDRSTASPIPWEHRKQLGRVRAFWRTIRLLTLGVKPLVQATGGPIDAVAARRFRWIVVALAALPLMAIVVGIWLTGGRGDVRLPDVTTGLPDSNNAIEQYLWQFGVLWSAGMTLIPVFPLGIVIAGLLGTNTKWCLAGSRLPSVRRQRAAAAGDYLCAPVVWTFLPVAAYAILTVYVHKNQRASAWPNLPAIVLTVFLDLVLSAYAIKAGLFAHTITHGRFGPKILRPLCLLLTWASAIAIGLVLFPMIVGYAWLVIDSLR